MTRTWIDKTLSAIRSAGLSARRGYPQATAAHLKEPLAVVCVQSAAQSSAVLAVHVYMPMELGGAGCEDMALMVAQLLRAQGATCTLGACGFENKEGVLRLTVQAEFTRSAQPGVMIGDVAVENVLSVETAYDCTTVKVSDENGQLQKMTSAERRWTVTVEDLLESTLAAQEPADDGFTLTIVRGKEREAYSGCCWDKITTRVTAQGICRVRKAITCIEPEVLEEA